MKKKVIITLCIIVIILLNLIMPKTIQASSTLPEAIETVTGWLTGIKDGGSLLTPISQFFCFIFDATINFLQDMFVTPENIRLEDGTYSIKYSPGVIFSGQVPALDIDFIHPQEAKEVTIIKNEDISLIKALDLNGAQEIYQEQYTQALITKKGVIRKIKKQKEYVYDKTREIDIKLLEGKISSTDSEMSFAGTAWKGETYTMELAWYNRDKSSVYIIVDDYELIQNHDVAGNTSSISIGIIRLYKVDMPKDLNDITNTTGDDVETSYTKKYDSSAGILQSIVATWYNALRRIALVGLLSVIVYIGIRILLTSTSAKDKAKYKSMLKDWLIALCLLFTLHYIMSITITVVDKINEVVKASSIATNGEDILMTSVRNKILNGADWDVVLSYVVVYSVLVVYTVIYTIQYVRRVIYLAFLTMIAPLITLTYPLDKVKDGKAQAFDMWIKDYVFFALIQVVHLLIYYILLGSAIDLADRGKWLYAIVAIGFVTPAEKLIKKMFGFEKSKTLGTMAAGATGALIMNALQKLPQGSKKSSSKEQGSSSDGGETKPVRTAGVNQFVNFEKESTTNNSTQTSSSSPNVTDENTNSQIPNTKKESKFAQLLKNNRLAKSESWNSFKLKTKRKIKGVRAVAGKYSAPVALGTIRFMAQTTGGLIGFSASVAKGADVTEIVTNTTLGAAAAKGVVNITVDGAKKVGKIPEKIDEAVDTYREGAYGKEAAQNAKFDRVFRNSREYRDLRDKSGISHNEFDKKVQKILDSGISKPKQMEKILKNNIDHPRKYNMDDAIKYSKLAEACSKDTLESKAKFIKFCQDRKINLSEEELNELRKNIINFK